MKKVLLKRGIDVGAAEEGREGWKEGKKEGAREKEKMLH